MSGVPEPGRIGGLSAESKNEPDEDIGRAVGSYAESLRQRGEDLVSVGGSSVETHSEPGEDIGQEPVEEEQSFEENLGSVKWGAAYDESNSRYVTAGDKNPFYHDEVLDYLVRGVYPLRLKNKGARKKTLDGFARNVRRSWKVHRDSDGDDVLFHEKMPGRHKHCTGERRTTYGTKVVPTKDLVPHVLAEVITRLVATAHTRQLVTSSWLRPVVVNFPVFTARSHRLPQKFVSNT